jgi:hypothetical protein
VSIGAAICNCESWNQQLEQHGSGQYTYPQILEHLYVFLVLMVRVACHISIILIGYQRRAIVCQRVPDVDTLS